MAGRVNLDAMIPREDFARTGEAHGDATNLIKEFALSNLEAEAPVRLLLRKPDFQRETNHWSPEQLVTFVASFVDNDVIPSLILWKSESFIFVIDGGHRLSALRAWMTDDYGDGIISLQFYNGEINDAQKKIAKRTRVLVEREIGRYATYKATVGKQGASPLQLKRANAAFMRSLQLQWVAGSPEVAETSFFKINSQGTPLDDTEQMLIVNRAKPIAVGARAIVRAGHGHRYWSKFSPPMSQKVEELASQIFELLFKPEVNTPLRTLDIPLGGSVSPVDSLSLIIDFLAISSSRGPTVVKISEWENDTTGKATVGVLRDAMAVSRRITGNWSESLGLHPAVYFYNERGRHSRFLFLGLAMLLASRLHNNDDLWFKKFTKARPLVEQFLIAEKSLIGILLQNMAKKVRVYKMRDLFAFLVEQGQKGLLVSPLEAIAHLEIKGRIFDGGEFTAAGSSFSDDAKAMVFIKKQLETTQKCPICGGYLDTSKSMSYDHLDPVSNGGKGSSSNMQLVHPFCNSAIKGG